MTRLPVKYTDDDSAVGLAKLLEDPAAAGRWRFKSSGWRRKLYRILERFSVMGAGGVAAGSMAWGTVTTFGTAGTGTAIASLKGAALTSAGLAALGFGTVAVGVVVLAALASAGSAFAIVAYRKWRREPVNIGDRIAMVIPGGIELCELAVEQLGKLPEPSSEAYQKLRDGMAWLADAGGIGIRQSLLAEIATEGGGWQCPYTGLETSDPSTIDIDHMVSWRELVNAYPEIMELPEEMRDAIYNDKTNLEAVSESWNAEKGATPWREWAETITEKGGSDELRARYEARCEEFMRKVELIINGDVDLYARAARWMAVLGLADIAGWSRLNPHSPVSVPGKEGSPGVVKLRAKRTRMAARKTWLILTVVVVVGGGLTILA